MSAKSANNPFAIQLEVEFLDRLSEPVREGHVKSVSDLIRTALERYNFDNVVVVRPAQLVISVRLPAELRRKLKQLSKSKHTSVGQLVRAAVEAYLPQIERESPAGGIEMPIPHIELPEAAPPAPPPAAAIAPAVAKKRVKKKRPTAKAAPRAKPGRSAAAPAAAPRPRRKPGGTAPVKKGMTRKRTRA